MPILSLQSRPDRRSRPAMVKGHASAPKEPSLARLGSRKVATLLLAGVCSALTAAASPTDQPSFLTLRSYCEPSFTIDGVSRRSGTGFLVEVLGKARRTYLLTAQHLFSVPEPEMPKRVTGAECAATYQHHVFSADAAVEIAGAHPMGPLGALKDIAAFPIKGWSTGLPLATNDAKPGDPVWLLARVKSGRETDQLLHRAVVGASNGFLAYRFDDQTIGLDQTSGGAIVNAAGEVVGLNIGYTRLNGGALIGVANRLSTLRNVVDALP